jgi:hypothetical protein
LLFKESSMRRNRFISRARHGGDADTLAKLARRLSESGTRLEDRLWERRLVELLNDRLARGFDGGIDAALEELARTDSRAYDDLADLAESCAESASIDIDGEPHDALLLALPMLAWSRYRLPAAALSPPLIDGITVQFGAHLAARGARVAVADTLFSIDQLPESLGEVHDVAGRMFAAAVERRPLKVDAKTLREPIAMLADTRYLLAAIVVPASAPLFHWQETGVDPDAKLSALEAFITQATAIVSPSMTGCRFRVLPPQPFHAALRQADRDLREFSLEAAIAYLKLAYDLDPNRLQAITGLFEDKREAGGAEVRIGVGLNGEDDTVIEGVVWPLLGDDEERAQEEIEAALKRLGVNHIVNHAQHFPMEYCDDCGAPLFPNAGGHPVHAEPPEDAEEQPAAPLH